MRVGPIKQEHGLLGTLRKIRVLNTSEATLDRTTDGILWVSKNLAGYNEFAAEALAYTVGRALGVRIPESRYKLMDDGSAQWLSRYVDAAGHWRAELVPQLEDLRDLARIVVLDSIIGNNDRHANNLVLEHLRSGIRLHAIDHEGAHVGTVADLESLGVAPHSPPPNHARGFPKQQLTPLVYAVEQETIATPTAQIAQAVDSALLEHPGTCQQELKRYKLALGSRVAAPGAQRYLDQLP